MSVLDKIVVPSDIKKFTLDELKQLCEEIRNKIIETAKNNGGHLASNLGIVETTVALHYVFDFPTDKLVFDVGHQCYTHKILSGRKDKFDTIRTEGGLSGFPDKDESEYDSFTTGHAGASLASGLGLCEARDLSGENYTVINVVGDGSIINGLNLEAMTSSEDKPKNYIVILNDNEMSISKNVNGLYKVISKRTVRPRYIKNKNRVKKILGNSIFAKMMIKFRNFIKNGLNKNGYFENFGFKYVGALDGNDLKEMVQVLERIKSASKNKAVLLHITTKKGKGYEQAEEHAEMYHGVGKNMNVIAGAYSTQAGETMASLIEKDKSVVVVTAAMNGGTGMEQVQEKYPKNVFDVGIAEEYAVTYAGGMARGGLKPFVAIYSTFLQRAYDEIMHDVCLQNLHVVFLIDRAGLVGSDGKTHQGAFDISYLIHLPNMTVLAPSNTDELKKAIEYAYGLNGPVAIRYPNDRTSDDREVLPFEKGLWERIEEGKDGNIISVGPRLLSVAKIVKARLKDKGFDLGIVNARAIKPLDIKMLSKIKGLPIITLEENSEIGGFGAFVKSKAYNVLAIGIKDGFIKHGTISGQLVESGLSEDEVCKKALEFLERK